MAEEEITCTEPIRNPIYTFNQPTWRPIEHTRMTPLAILVEGAEKYPEKDCIGLRKLKEDGTRDKEFSFWNYKQTCQRVACAARKLEEMDGGEEGRGNRIVVLCAARVQMLEMSMICAAAHRVFVPVNERGSEETLGAIMANCEPTFAMMDCKADAPLVAYFEKFFNGDKSKIIMTEKAEAEKVGCVWYDSLVDYEAFEADKKKEEKKEKKEKEKEEEADTVWVGPEPAMDEMWIIVYTSGTTGTPKGVMISHGNMTAAVSAFLSCVPEYMWKDDYWVYLNFLPLSHIYGLEMCYVALGLFGSVGFFSNSIKDLIVDIQALKPSLIAAVPRVYQRFYEVVLNTINKKNIFARTAFWTAYKWKRRQIAAGHVGPSAPDKILSAVRNNFGGRAAILLTGGAPAPPEVVEFFRCTLTPVMYDGYGMTETTAAGIRSQFNAPFEHTGYLSPFYNTEMKIVSVPEMGYLATDNPPRGELCIRGPQISKGYYKDPEATALAFDEEGYVHTGDIVVLCEPHQCKIIDRKKNMFKLAQGEYVSGEAIEAALSRSPAINSIFVHGESTQRYPIAIIVPDPDHMKVWAQENGLKDMAEDMAALCKEQKVHDYIESEIKKWSKEAELKGYEIVQAFHLHELPFDEARNFVSPSLKLKRHILRTYFKDELEKLYQ